MEKQCELGNRFDDNHRLFSIKVRWQHTYTTHLGADHLQLFHSKLLRMFPLLVLKLNLSYWSHKDKIFTHHTYRLESIYQRPFKVSWDIKVGRQWTFKLNLFWQFRYRQINRFLRVVVIIPTKFTTISKLILVASGTNQEVVSVAVKCKKKLHLKCKIFWLKIA